MKKALVIALGALTTATSASAMEVENKFYVGADYVQNKLDTQNGSGAFYEDSAAALGFYAGVDVHENVAIEAGYNAGFEESKSAGAVTTDFTITAYYLDLIGKYEVADKVTVLGSIGAAKVNLEANVKSGGSSSVAENDDTGLRLGAGVEYQVTDNVAARVKYNYTDLEFNGFGSLSQLTVGASYKF